MGILEEALGFFWEPALTTWLPMVEEVAGGQRWPRAAWVAGQEQSLWARARWYQKHFNGVQSYVSLCALSVTLIPLLFFFFVFFFWSPLSSQGSELPPLPPVLTLRFSYIRPDRHLRRYVVLEPDAQAAVQVMGPRRLVGAWKLRAGVLLLTAVSGHPVSGAACCVDPSSHQGSASAGGSKGPAGGQTPVSTLWPRFQAGGYQVGTGQCGGLEASVPKFRYKPCP